MTFLIAHLPIVPFEPFCPASRYHSQIDDDRSFNDTTTQTNP